MYDDLNDHPVAVFAQGESYVSDSEQQWLRWVKKVERLLGHDLDGNQDRDGYSLDLAYDCWKQGDVPEQYVSYVAVEKKRLARRGRFPSDITYFAFVGLYDVARADNFVRFDIKSLLDLYESKAIGTMEFARAVLREAGRAEMLASGAFLED